MGFLGRLFGHRGARRAPKGRFFAVIKAAESLKTKADLRPTNKGGIVFSPTEDPFFEKLDSRLMEMLRASPESSGARLELANDLYGTRWVVLDHYAFPNLVASVHLVGNAFVEGDFGKRLLAAALQIEYGRQKAYWIYNYKRGCYYPFVPTGDKARDGKAEIKLGELMEEEKVPVERTLEVWYAVWGIPF